MAAMINNKVFMTNSSKLYYAEFIGDRYFGIYGKIKKKYVWTRPPPSSTLMFKITSWSS